MKYCNSCGKQLADNAQTCPECGYVFPTAMASVAAVDAPNTGLAVLGFLIPLVGLILWAVWNNTTPLKAKSAGKGALIGVIVHFAVGVIYFTVVMSMMSKLGAGR